MNSSNSWRVSNMSSCPKLRIEGFTDVWEQRKFVETFDFLPNNSLSRAQLTYENGTVKNVHYGDVLIKFGELLDVGNEELPYLIDDSLIKNYSSAVLKNGDVVIADAAEDETVGKCSEIKGIKDDKILSGLHTIPVRPRVEFENGYLGYFMNSHSYHDQLLPLIQGTKVSSISKKVLENTVISYPASSSEQEKIAKFFESLTNLITLHQRKSDALKNAKKYFLKNMFPSEGEKFPKLRLEGFTDAWEQRKLGEYIIEYKEVTTQNDQYPPLTSSRRGIFLQTEYFDGNQIASKDNVGYNIVPYGYFTYRHMSDDDIFHFNINTIVENVIVSTLYPVFTTNNELDSKYLQYQLNYGHEFAKYAIMQKQGGSRTYMYLNKLKQLYITMPLSVDEQKKISFFFSKLDDLITLHQRKCDALKNAKKFFLQNMFV